MFIDIHVHAQKHDKPLIAGLKWFSSPDEIIKRYDELDIKCGILLPLIGPEVYVGQSNEEVIEMARESDGRLIPFFNIDPRAVYNSSDSPLGNLFEHYKKLGCKGLGEVTANLSVADPRVQNLFKFCEEFEMPLTFHLAAQIGGMYGLYDEPGLPNLELAIKKYSKLKFFAHSQTFWAEMGRLETPADRYGYPAYAISEEGVIPKFFRRYPNLYGDLSAGSGCNAIKRDREFGIKFLNEFQDRLFFGTDICGPETPTPLVDYLLELKNSGEITEAVFKKIAYENAARILDI